MFIRKRGNYEKWRTLQKILRRTLQNNKTELYNIWISAIGNIVRTKCINYIKEKETEGYKSLKEE